MGKAPTILIMLSAKQGGIKYHFFWVFGMTQLGIEPRSPRPLVNTLLIRPMARFIGVELYRSVWVNTFKITMWYLRIKVLRNKFDALQEISEILTLNDKYENFVNAHMETAAKFIPTKLKAKHRVPWETLTIRNSIPRSQLMPTLRNLRRHKEN